ncbi:MAG: hypothetical protein Q9228_003109 [Teloschistes exilis]
MNFAYQLSEVEQFYRTRDSVVKNNTQVATIAHAITPFTRHAKLRIQNINPTGTAIRFSIADASFLRWKESTIATATMAI